MAGISALRQVGKFKNNKKEYMFEMEKKAKSEIYNFYTVGDKILICSVYTSYNSKHVGVRKAGEFTREVYGSYDVYINFVNAIENGRNFNKDVSSATSLIMDEKTGDFLHLIQRKSIDNRFMHKQYVMESVTKSETIQQLDENGTELLLVEYFTEEEGKSVQCKKLKDKEYTLREHGEKDVKKYPMKTLEMIGLEKDLSWLECKKYSIINTKEEFDKLIEELRKVPDDEVVGFDTETTGLLINRFPIGHPKRDRLVGICISWQDNISYYIPIYHKLFDNIDENYCIEQLRPLICEKFASKYNKDGQVIKHGTAKNLVTHNGKFDWRVMYTYGIKLNFVHDTLLMQYLTNEGEFRTRKDLKTLARKELGMEMVELEDNYIKQKGIKLDIDFSLLPYENVKAYAPADADATRLLFKKKRIPKSMEFIYYIEIELMKYIAKTEYNGIRLDLELIAKQEVDAEKKKAELEQKIYDLVGHTFNIKSNVDLGNVMFTELKYPIIEWTDKKAPKTGKRTLKILAADKCKNEKGEIVQKYPFAVLLKTYKDQEKLLNGFLRKMLTENIDGFIFPSYDQCGTESGRISCNGPNLQQTPGKNREAICTDGDDYYFCIADYSQVEYRIMAGFGQEMDIIESFKDPETDHHSNMYSRMFNVPLEEVTSAQRKIGKLLNFGVTYGMGPYSLAITLFDDTSPEKIQEAADLTRLYFDSVPRIRDMLEESKDFASLYGYIETKFGRRRYFPEIRSNNRKIIDDNRRKAANTRVQGTGADILKIAHVKIERAIERLGLDAQIKISMHDELVVQTHKSINPWFMYKLMRECMEIQIKDFPPLFIGFNVGSNWAAGKRDDLEVPILLGEEMFAKGEHLKPGYKDPEKEVGAVIKEYVYNELIASIQEKNLNTVKKALDNPGVESKLKNYFGCSKPEEFEAFLNKIFAGEQIDLGSGHVVYNDIELKFIEDTDEDDEDDEKGELNIAAIKGLSIVNLDELELEETVVGSATDYYRNNYDIIEMDRTCYIKVDRLDVEGLVELKEYLQRNTANKGVGVQLVKFNPKLGRNEFIKTPYALYKIDKIDLFGILDKYNMIQKSA